ncbi:MAG: DMT family transporter [Pseudomonadota bacterium]
MIYISATLFLFGVFFVPLSGVIATYLLDAYTVSELSWIRFGSTLVIMAPISARGEIGSIKFISLAQLFLLGLSTLLAFFAFLFSITGIPVAKTTAIFFSYPLIIVVLSHVFMQERAGLLTWAQTLFGFIGVALILSLDGKFGIYEAAALVSGIAVALRLILTRRVASSVSPSLIVAAECLVATIVLTAFIDASILEVPEHLGLLASYVICANLSRFAVVYALRLSSASNLAPLAFFELLFAILLEGIIRGIWISIEQIPAMLLICFAGLAVSLRASRNRVSSE